MIDLQFGYKHDYYDLNTNEQTISFLFLTGDQCHNITDVQLHCWLCKEAPNTSFDLPPISSFEIFNTVTV